MAVGSIFGFLLGDTIQPLFVESTPPYEDALVEYWFTPAERAEILRLNSWRRASRVAGHIAAKKTLTHMLDVSPHDITIDHHPSGAPFACVQQDVYPVSLSHVRTSGTALASPIVSRQFGVDMVYDRGQQIADLVLRVTTLAEREWLNGGDVRGRFFDLWVLKEAALKAWGVGMRLAPWDVEVSCPTSAVPAALINAVGYNLPELHGSVFHDAAPSITLGFAWLDRRKSTDRRLWDAYRRPRGLHLGC